MASVIDNEEGGIDDVERSLRDQLASVHLVGEIDLDVWGPKAETALRTRANRCEPDRMGRLWPATLVTYIVHQALIVYDDAFWRYVSIPGLQEGQKVGPAFERALEKLGLPTFSDIEKTEGISKYSRGRFIRRMHLHGGMPKNSVKDVLGLLSATLRSGATSTPEVLDLWAGLDLQATLNSRSAARCLLYTGDFAEKLIGQMIELLRVANKGGDLSTVEAPSHLVQGVQDHITNPTDQTSWNFVAGPTVRIDAAVGEPYLRVPAGYDVIWSVNGEELGFSSRQVEQQFPLRPSDEGWTVVSNQNGELHSRRFVADGQDEPVFVFDERGRLHRRGTDLGGIRAHVVARSGTKCTDETDRRSLGDAWSEFELATVDLRDSDELVVNSPDGHELRIPVDNVMTPRISRGVVHGFTSGGIQIVTGTVTLALDGYVPDPANVMIDTGFRATSLDRLPRDYGEFDISSCFDRDKVATSMVTVTREGCGPTEFWMVNVPDLKLDRPALARADESIPVELQIREGTVWRGTTVEVPADDDTIEVDLDLSDGDRRFEIRVNRLLWALDGPDTVAPMFDAERFVIRASELHRHELLLQTGGPGVRVSVLDGPVSHEEWGRKDGRDDGIHKVKLGAFADTVRSSTSAHHRLVVLHEDADPIVIGWIESRYQPLSIDVEYHDDPDEPLLDIQWSELASWSGREVRLWGRTIDDPVLVHPIEDSECSVLLDVSDLPEDRYLVEVAVHDGWGSRRRPREGVGVRSVYVGSPEAQRLVDAVKRADGDEPFDDEVLDRLAPLMADMIIETVRSEADRPTRMALLTRVADDRWRASEVIHELHDRMGGDDDTRSANLLEPYLLDLLPMLWVFPVDEKDGDVRDDDLDHLWQIAPMAAACLDFVRTSDGNIEDDCRYRWRHYTGFPMERSSALVKSLDRLVPSKDSQHSGWDSVELLDAAAWGEAVHEVTSKPPAGLDWTGFDQYRPFVAQIEHRSRSNRHSNWSGIPLRVERHVKGLANGAQRLIHVTLLACEVLEPTSIRHEAETLEILRVAQTLAPIATRTAFIYSATALRLRQAVGPAGGLVS